MLGEHRLTNRSRVFKVKTDTILPNQSTLLNIGSDRRFDRSTSGVLKLIKLRWIALVSQVIALVVTVGWLNVELPVLGLVGCLLILALSNLCLSYLSAKLGHLIGLVILLDVLILTALLALSGGPSNPFSVLYLVQVLLAAVMTSQKWTWGVAILSSFGFALIFWFHLPLPSSLGGHGHHHSSFSLHLQGMWLAYTIAAIAIGLFVSKLSTELNRERERRVEGEKVLGLAALAAGAAHEIRNPLGTIRLITSDLESALRIRDHSDTLLLDIDLINQEIGRASLVLDRLTESAGELKGEPIIPIKATLFFTDLEARFKTQQNVQFKLSDELSDLYWPKEAVFHALMQLIRNSIQASDQSQTVSVNIQPKQQGVLISIVDQGVGMSSEILKNYGTPFFTTRGQIGMGLGVFVAKSLIERLNGDLNVSSIEGDGTEVKVWIPYQVFMMEPIDD
jgi:two-component system, sensor histidine kinase RegB